MASDLPERDESRGKNPLREFLLIIGIAVLVSLVLVLWIRGGLRPAGGGFGGLAVGESAPKIDAVGWVNGEAPTPERLAGKVVVIDAWATWCLPCRIKMPELIETYRKFEGRDVVFVGLTSETEQELPQIDAFVEDLEVPWVIGYVADETLIALQAEVIPLVWVIGPDGKVVWNSGSPGTVDDGIEEALAAGRGSVSK